MLSPGSACRRDTADALCILPWERAASVRARRSPAAPRSMAPNRSAEHRTSRLIRCARRARRYAYLRSEHSLLCGLPLHHSSEPACGVGVDKPDDFTVGVDSCGGKVLVSFPYRLQCSRLVRAGYKKCEHPTRFDSRIGECDAGLVATGHDGGDPVFALV